MTQDYEFVQIEQRGRSIGLLSSVYWYEAVLMGGSERVIAKSKEWKLTMFFGPVRPPGEREAHKEIVNRLIVDGWEPALAGGSEVRIWKRPVNKGQTS